MGGLPAQQYASEPQHPSHSCAGRRGGAAGAASRASHRDVVEAICLLIKVHNLHRHRLIAAGTERPVDDSERTLEGGGYESRRGGREKTKGVD